MTAAVVTKKKSQTKGPCQDLNQRKEKPEGQRFCAITDNQKNEYSSAQKHVHQNQRKESLEPDSKHCKSAQIEKNSKIRYHHDSQRKDKSSAGSSCHEDESQMKHPCQDLNQRKEKPEGQRFCNITDNHRNEELSAQKCVHCAHQSQRKESHEPDSKHCQSALIEKNSKIHYHHDSQRKKKSSASSSCHEDESQTKQKTDSQKFDKITVPKDNQRKEKSNTKKQKRWSDHCKDCGQNTTLKDDNQSKERLYGQKSNKMDSNNQEQSDDHKQGGQNTTQRKERLDGQKSNKADSNNQEQSDDHKQDSQNTTLKDDNQSKKRSDGQKSNKWDSDNQEQSDDCKQGSQNTTLKDDTQSKERSEI